MKKRKLGKNHGVWSGTVATGLEFSHEVKDRKTNEIVESFYKFYIETEISYEKDGELRVVNQSVLPVTVSESNLRELNPSAVDVADTLKIGEIVFIKGSWRAYDYKSKEESRTRLDQTAYVKIIEKHEDYQVRTRNKFEFEGVLVKKLYEYEKDAEGRAIRDEKGRLIPKTDEEGNEVFTVRKNRENKIVNDFTVAINRPNGSDYIPSIAYGRLAKHIAKNIDKGAEVEGVGYIRTRTYTDGSGTERVAYEAVVTQLVQKEVDDADVQEHEMEKTEE